MRRIRIIHLQIALIILTIVMTGLTFTEIVARTVHSDPTRVNMYSNWFHGDYYQYLAGIVRGQHGLFWYRSFFTVPNPPTIPIYMLYQILGIITAPFSIWAPIVYHVSRLSFIVFSVWSLYVLSFTILKSKRWGIVSTILGILITNPPAFLYNPVIAIEFRTWWSVLTAYDRMNAQPHYLLARGLLCLSIAWYISYRSLKKRKYLLGSSIAAVLCVFNVPHTAVPFFAIVCVGVLWDSIHAYRHSTSIRTELVPLLTLIAPLISLGIINRSMQIPLWITASLWERDFDLRETWTNYHYYISHLYLLFPAYIGFVLFAKKKDIRGYLLLLWVLIPLLFSPFFYWLKVGGLRFDMFIYIIIPLSILSCVAIRSAMTSGFWKRIAVLYVALVLLLSSVSTVLYAKYLWTMVVIQPLYTAIFPPKDYFELFDWIKNNISEDHVLLASPEIGTLIVSQAPVFAYIGEQTRGSNVALNTYFLERFYSELMNTEEALAFLKARDVTFVVQDPKFIWPLRELSYPFLVKKWQNSQLGIYQVNYAYNGR